LQLSGSPTGQVGIGTELLNSIKKASQLFDHHFPKTIQPIEIKLKNFSAINGMQFAENPAKRKRLRRG